MATNEELRARRNLDEMYGAQVNVNPEDFARLLDDSDALAAARTENDQLRGLLAEAADWVPGWFFARIAEAPGGAVVTAATPASGDEQRPGDVLHQHPRWSDGSPMLVGQLASCDASEANEPPPREVVTGRIVTVWAEEITVWYDDDGKDCSEVVLPPDSFWQPDGTVPSPVAPVPSDDELAGLAVAIEEAANEKIVALCMADDRWWRSDESGRYYVGPTIAGDGSIEWPELPDVVQVPRAEWEARQSASKIMHVALARIADDNPTNPTAAKDPRSTAEVALRRAWDVRHPAVDRTQAGAPSDLVTGDQG